jgi:hypothetical protein
MELWLTISALLVSLFLLDDLFIDFIGLIFRLGPDENFNFKQVRGRNKRLAIMVANWKEHDVIEAMVKANAPLLQNNPSGICWKKRSTRST